MKKLTIYLDDEELAVLEKRAKKNFFTLKEQVEDIIRRSCIVSKGKSKSKPIKVDDKLIGIFSRQRSGRPRKSKAKKSKKKK
jgi:hypothetical protein